MSKRLQATCTVLNSNCGSTSTALLVSNDSLWKTISNLFNSAFHWNQHYLQLSHSTLYWRKSNYMMHLIVQQALSNWRKEANDKCINASSHTHTHRIIFMLEEFTTHSTHVKVILNSWFKEVVTNDQQHLSTLAPWHVHIERTLNGSLGSSLLDTDVSRSPQRQAIQQRVQQFWTHWFTSCIQHVSYLPETIVNDIWHGPSGIMLATIHCSSHQLHLLMTNSTSSLIIGKVIVYHPGKDDLTPVVITPTSTSTLTRPIYKHALLPLIPGPDA